MSRIEESIKLHADLWKYMEETGTRDAIFSKKVGDDPKLIYDLRKGRKIGAVLEEKIRNVMGKYPYGIGEDRRSPAIGNFINVFHVDMPDDIQHVDRDPCYKCGVRKDIGCECPNSISINEWRAIPPKVQQMMGA